MPTLHTMLLRHALYVHGARGGVASDFRKVATNLDTEITRIVGTRQLDTMTKAEFNTMMARLRRSLSRVLSRDVGALGQTLREFNDISISSYQRIFRRNTRTRKAVDKKRIWGQVNARDIGATGKTLDKTARAFQQSTITEIERQVRIGYANKQKTVDVLSRIHGGKRNTITKVRAWADSLADTSFTHVNAATNFETARRYYDEYDWVSTIDDVTTEVCRERHGQRYRYGEGPLPPAHYKCRSEVMPVDPEAPTLAPQSFGDWLAEQPADFRRDVFKRGRRDLDNVKLITLDHFKDKTAFVLAD